MAIIDAMFLVSALVVVDSPRNRPQIRGSDVVFMYPASDPEQYDQYDGTIVGWGGRPRFRDERSVAEFTTRVRYAHERGMKYCGSVDFLVDFRGLMDFLPDKYQDCLCVDLDGNPIRVPWLWDHEYKGVPFYWGCTNNPDYLAYLRDQTERACLAPIDGLHIDDYSGTSHCSEFAGGCFCRYCMTGFRKYLRTHMDTETMTSLGITDLDSFDYGSFLKSRGITADEYKRNRRNLPLGNEFQDFQNSQMILRITEIFEYAEKLRGRQLLRSINSSASSPRTIIPAPCIDYFCGEIGHSASRREVPVEPVFVYKMVEALGKKQTATASGYDWAWIKANEKPGLVRAWIAQAYAFGSVFMVPHRQWCFTSELGTHWWHGKPEDFAPIYRFVRRNRNLLDGYRTLAWIGLISTNAGFSKIREASLKLAEANVPFSILAMDRDSSLSRDELSRFDCLILGEERLTEEIGRVTDAQLFVWNGTMPEVQPVSVMGADKIRISLMHRPGDDSAPIVCHLLNQRYDFDSDRMLPQNPTVKITEDSLRGRKVKHAVVHRPDSDPVELDLTADGDGISFKVDRLDLWAIVELK